MSHSNLEIARQRLLAPAGIDEGDLNKVFGRLLGHAVDSGDLYFQSTRFESWVLEDGIVKDGSYNIEQGVGVRAVSGEKTGFAYSDELTATALDQAVSAARGIAEQGGDGRFQVGRERVITPRYVGLNPLDSLTREQKIALLQQMDINLEG